MNCSKYLIILFLITSSLFIVQNASASTPPNPPTPTSPSHNIGWSDSSAITPGNITFTWINRGDPENNPLWFYFYLVQWNGSSWITHTSAYTSAIGVTTITRSLTEGYYAWQVAAIDATMSSNPWHKWGDRNGDGIVTSADWMLLRMALPPSSPGNIIIDPSFPNSFKFDTGARFFPMGDTVYNLLESSESQIHSFIDLRKAAGFNFLRFGAMTVPAETYWPFGGTPSSPNFLSVNETALQKLDRVFDYAESKGMYIELILWTYGPGIGNWGNTTQEKFWVDTIAARYGGRKGLFMFTIANEFERYSSGSYQYSASDVDWARRMADRVAAKAPGRLISVHPSKWVSDDGQYTYNAYINSQPVIVWPLWESSNVSILNQQNKLGVMDRAWVDGQAEIYATTWEGINFPATWTSEGWEIEAPGIEDSIAGDFGRGKPVLDTEFGYQYEPGNDSSQGVITQQAYTPKSTRIKMWKIITSGGYIAAGFIPIPTLKTEITNPDNWRPQAFTILYNFFTGKTQYWKLDPHHELASDVRNTVLALPGTEYIAYLVHGGPTSITLTAGTYAIEWINPRTGGYTNSGTITVSTGNRSFTPPNSTTADWVLHLKK